MPPQLALQELELCSHTWLRNDENDPCALSNNQRHNHSWIPLIYRYEHFLEGKNFRVLNQILYEENFRPQRGCKFCTPMVQSCKK